MELLLSQSVSSFRWDSLVVGPDRHDEILHPSRWILAISQLGVLLPNESCIDPFPADQHIVFIDRLRSPDATAPIALGPRLQAAPDPQAGSLCGTTRASRHPVLVHKPLPTHKQGLFDRHPVANLLFSKMSPVRYFRVHSPCTLKDK